MSHYLTLVGIGQPIAYYPRLGVMLRCVKAGIFLGQIIYWHDKTQNPLGVYKTAIEIEVETGLSEKEQRTARKKLTGLGLITETNKRIEHKMYYKFNPLRFDEWFDEVIHRQVTKPQFPNLPTGRSGTTETAVRGQPNGEFVITKNTTKITTKITNKKNCDFFGKNCKQNCLSRNQDVTRPQIKLSEKQVLYFSVLLAESASFGSNHAIRGESTEDFKKRIEGLLRDPTFASNHFEYLSAVGFVVKTVKKQVGTKRRGRGET